MKSRLRTSVVVWGILIALLGIWVNCGSCTQFSQNNIAEIPDVRNHGVLSAAAADSSQETDIAQLTKEDVVVPYVRMHHALPHYYITKSEAVSRGWLASKGNLCEVLPGHAIGGDRFGNREGALPKQKGRIYFEADLNYDCGVRNADRLIYSNDGLIFITRDHYQTFQQQ